MQNAAPLSALLVRALERSSPPGTAAAAILTT